MNNHSNDYDEEAWIAEAERRYASYKNGSIESRAVSLVLHDARQLLKKSAGGADEPRFLSSHKES